MSSTFFDYKKLTSAPCNETTTVSSLAWHPKLNLLAAALTSTSSLASVPSSLSPSSSLANSPSTLTSSPSSSSATLVTATSANQSAVQSQSPQGTASTTAVWVASASTTTGTSEGEGGSGGIGGGGGGVGGEADEVVARRPFPVTCLAWDPSAKVLLIGWSDGTIPSPSHSSLIPSFPPSPLPTTPM